MMGHQNKLKNKRSERKPRKLRLGRYLIVTDARETEPNYFEGIRKNIPPQHKGDIQIKICGDKDIGNLVEFAKEERNKGQYSEIWLIFDKDEDPYFDERISQAHRKNINVGWSNPCFETWLIAYFGKTPKATNAGECCANFAKEYCKVTNKDKYVKSDKALYENLLKHGDEAKAIKLAKQRYEQSKKDCKKQSEMLGCKTVFELVGEIRSKIEVTGSD